MIAWLIRSWRGRRSVRNAGTAAVELAITAPLLVVLVLGITDYGMLMNSSAALFGAARNGAEYVAAYSTDPNLATDAKQQVCGFFGLTLNNGSCSPVTPSVSNPFCTCVGSPSTVTCPGAGAPNPCSGTNPTDPRVLTYVSVHASQNFTPLFAVANFFYMGGFGFPTNPLTATINVRIQ
jgi:Flp pilus assembly protein TadG